MSTTLPTLKFFKVDLDPATKVLHVKFDHGEKNLMTSEVWGEYGSIFDNILIYGDARVVVVSSMSPTHFTGGMDMAAMGSTLTPKDPDTGRSTFRIRDLLRQTQVNFSAPERTNVPVIFAIHGKTVALGIELALAGDIVYTASDATFAMKEVDVGFASDVGTLARGPKAFSSSSLLAELAFTGRTFGAEQAYRLGFTSCVVEGSRDEVVDAALKLAAEIAGKSPVAVASTKRMLLHARDHTVESALEYAQIWNGAMLQTEDVRRALTGQNNFRPLYDDNASKK